MPSYCEQLLEANPGSFITLERTATNQFHRFFLCYYASAKGFASCKPLLGVDGTHLRSHYQGILLTATATDAGGQLFPVASSISKTKKTGYGSLNNCGQSSLSMFLTFWSKKTRWSSSQIAPAAKGLHEGVPVIFPLAAHGYCLKHLEKNLKSTYKNPTLVTLLWKMAAAKTPCEFDELFEKFQEINPKAAEWLLGEADPRYWVDCYFPSRRYGHYTSNIAESLNSWLLTAREQPLRPMMETIRMKLMDWFAHRREEGTKMQANQFVSKLPSNFVKLWTTREDILFTMHSTPSMKFTHDKLAKTTWSIS
ncbi:MAG: transposase [Bacteroidetes bacterium]|nr:MAG: transposase [Bacteroidota bacterium]